MEFRDFIVREMTLAHAESLLTGKLDGVDSLGIMTPTNPEAQRLSHAENQRLKQAFVAQLRQQGHGPVKLGGKFGNREESYLIENISREEMVRLGAQFRQESVIWGQKVNGPKGPTFRFEYIEGNVTKAVRDTVLIGPSVDSRRDNYSTFHGHKFVIPFFDKR